MKKALAYATHIYTGTGVLLSLLIAWSISEGDYRHALIWMMAALIIDSTDGFLARLLEVKRSLPGFDGRKLDDIVDYLNYSFLPLFMIGHAGWLPFPWVLWAFLAALASLFGFCNTRAKEEEEGFFLGFPSYWNVVALYYFLLLPEQSPLLRLVILLGLAVGTLLPIRFIYPSHFRRWRLVLMGGAVLWLGLILWVLFNYPAVSAGWIWLSTLFPGLYVALSLWSNIPLEK